MPTPTPGPGGLYVGVITDQFMASDQDDVHLVLTVSVTECVTDEKDPAGGTTACTHAEVEVRLTFAASGKWLDMRVRDLEKLGYPHDDLGRLHPDHPECHPLTGVKVHVRPKDAGGVTYWNLAWPRAKPKAAEFAAIKGATAALADTIAAARAAKAKSAPVTAPRPAAGGEE